MAGTRPSSVLCIAVQGIWSDRYKARRSCFPALLPGQRVNGLAIISLGSWITCLGGTAALGSSSSPSRWDGCTLAHHLCGSRPCLSRPEGGPTPPDATRPQINFGSYEGVFAKHTSDAGGDRRRRPRRVLTRMQLPTARIAPKALRANAYLSSTSAPSLPGFPGLRALALAPAGLVKACVASVLGGKRPAHESESLAPGDAVFKPRVVRFVGPVVFCHAPGLPPGTMLKVRSAPCGGGEGEAGGARRLVGRVGPDQCVVGLATSGDWLQVRYGNYGAAWMLLRYAGRRMLAPLADVHPGVAAEASAMGQRGGSGGVGVVGVVGGRLASPFKMAAGLNARDSEGGGGVVPFG